jgi:hypothetical protein
MWGEFIKRFNIYKDSRLKIRLVGNSFSHITSDHFGYSVHGKVSNSIKWVKSKAKFTIYVDNAINDVFKTNDQSIKFAWLLESKFITPTIVENIKSNPTLYLDKFDLIFTHNQELLKISPRFKWVPAQGFWIKNAQLYPKSKKLSMITSNKSITEGHKYRLSWVKKLDGQVDLYGRGFKEIKLKEEGLCDYMYSVVIENGSYNSYFTEKILDCFATGTIPIYSGSADIGDFFNSDGIIKLEPNFKVEDISESDYFNRLNAVKDNLERVRKMEILEDFIFENYLKNLI